MTIKIKVRQRMSYTLPNWCVFCGEKLLSKGMVFVDSGQIFSHSTCIFFVCDKCNKYIRSDSRVCRLSKSQLEKLPFDEQRKAGKIINGVMMIAPFFYIGKVTFIFKNELYGRTFCEMNGGEIYSTD